MPIKSYLAFPKKGQKALLEKSLSTFPACEVLPSENKDLLIIVSETANHEEEELLLKELNQIGSLHHLNLVAGFDNEN